MMLTMVCHNRDRYSSFKDNMKLLMFSSIMFAKGMEELRII